MIFYCISHRCSSSPSAISAQRTWAIWCRENICCVRRKASSFKVATAAAAGNTVLVCICIPPPQIYLLFIVMRLTIDSAWTTQPSLRARSPVPLIHSGDRMHPSILSLHARSEFQHSQWRPGGHAVVVAEEKNSSSSWEGGVNMSLKTGRGCWCSAEQNWSRRLLITSLVNEIKKQRWGCRPARCEVKCSGSRWTWKKAHECKQIPDMI